jgi:two-component system, NtrC family, sensor kinase
MLKTNLRQWLFHLKVAQKIGLGYTLALGVAVSGTIAGFTVGNRYYQRAFQQQEHTRHEMELLHRLQTSVLQVRTHQQQLIPLAQSPQNFDEEYGHILHVHGGEVKQFWTDLNIFVDTQPSWLGGQHTEEIPSFLKQYEGVTEAYLRELEHLVEDIRSSQPTSSAAVAKARKLLLDFTNSDLALQFDGISDDLVGLIETSSNEIREANKLAEQSRDIAQKIVIGSIGLSVVIAILLAILTSRAISRPIQSLTQVAQRSIEESNFDLQSPVESKDEIGSLSNSFNLLIHSVKQLLEQQQATNRQLADYSQTLEAKVKERTQELNDKNSQLQDTLKKLHQSQIQIVQSEKMSSLGQLVAGLAHEINNPINFIHGNLIHVQEYAHNLLNFVQLYQKHCPNPSAEVVTEAEEIDLEFLQADLPKILDSMKIGTERIRQIVLSLRNFSRMDEADFKAVDIHEGIDSTLLILQHRLKEKPERPAIQVIRDYGTLPPIECYPGQLNQAFMNILANAIDALEEANAKRMYQECKENPSKIIIRTSTLEANWVEIVISDNGVGMPESIHKRIFDPFFTTKAVGKGTGMGMPISYQIVTEKHKGKLHYFSIPGKGTEFTIQIPVRQQVYDAVS